MSDITKFSVDCQQCSRLSSFLDKNRSIYEKYYNLPVPSFGPKGSNLLIVGLAPGLHGANKTGKPFMGDHAGVILYTALYKFGFSSHPESIVFNDKLNLINCRITNAVRCVPPQNKPTREEIDNCLGFLKEEILDLPKKRVILALGRIAHQSVVKSFEVQQSKYKFNHGNVHKLGLDQYLIDSYHCSRYNTQTRRLTKKMFENVFSWIANRIAKF